MFVFLMKCSIFHFIFSTFHVNNSHAHSMTMKKKNTEKKLFIKQLIIFYVHFRTHRKKFHFITSHFSLLLHIHAYTNIHIPHCWALASVDSGEKVKNKNSQTCFLGNFFIIYFFAVQKSCCCYYFFPCNVRVHCKSFCFGNFKHFITQFYVHEEYTHVLCDEYVSIYELLFKFSNFVMK